MAWEKLRNIFGRKGESPSHDPDIAWIEAADTPWGVRVLDVRPVTLSTLSISGDPQCAANAMSFEQEDGASFIGKEPPVTRSIDANLRFPIDRVLAEGVLFTPSEMEHKYALFYRCGEILCVRSWLRQVEVIARVEAHQDHIELTGVRGTFESNDEDPEFTVRALDYLLRSHALETVYPAPLPAGAEKDPKKAARWCMSMFGNKASFAAPYPVPYRVPDKPLRTHSLLHIAVARGDVPAIEDGLSAGIPIDLLAGDGLAPLHWAMVRPDTAIMSFLLDHGSPVDVRSSEGATPLMNAVQDASLVKAAFLLDHGADVNARDQRGFTALHRAAGMGLLDVTGMLLDRGASPDSEAGGYTPRSLAEAQGKTGIVDLLSKYGSSVS